MSTAIQTPPVVHPSAIVQDGAQIAAGVIIGPYCVIGPKVVIGQNSILYSHVVVEGRTNIGVNNQIFPFASIGTAPQDLKFRGEDSELTIGDGNTIREYVTIQPGTAGGGMRTVIGTSNLFMACSHVGHDCFLGNANIIANSAAIAGHVVVGDRVTIGGLCGIHQFVKIGDMALLGGGAMVTKDIPPYCIAQGDRAKVVGFNRIGLERAGYVPDEIDVLQRSFKQIFRGEGTLLARAEKVAAAGAASPLIDNLVNFIKESERGVAGMGNSDQ